MSKEEIKKSWQYHSKHSTLGYKTEDLKSWSYSPWFYNIIGILID